jgi:hypothetical protein
VRTVVDSSDSLRIARKKVTTRTGEGLGFGLGGLGKVKLALEPGTNLLLHEVELWGGGTRGSLKEVFCAFDPDELLRLGGAFEDGFDDGARAVFVVIAADEELGLGALWEEAVGIVASACANRKAKTDEAFHAGVSAAGAQSDVGTEGEAGEEDREIEILIDPIERGMDVLLLAAAIVVSSFAQADAAEVEAEHGEAEGRECLHGVIDNLVVHSAAAVRVGVADECGVRSVFAT